MANGTDGDQLALRHDGGDVLALVGAAVDLGAQQLAGAEVGVAVLRGDAGALGALRGVSATHPAAIPPCRSRGPLMPSQHNTHHA